MQIIFKEVLLQRISMSCGRLIIEKENFFQITNKHVANMHDQLTKLWNISSFIEWIPNKHETIILCVIYLLFGITMQITGQVFWVAC